MKMKYLLFIILILSIISCAVDYDYDYRIIKLSYQELSYEELPKDVKTLFHAASIGRTKKDRLLFVDSTDISTFYLKETETISGPWIAYFKLIDNKKQISYRIDYSLPFPYILYQNKLYIPEKAEVFYNKEKIYALRYMEYKLK